MTGRLRRILVASMWPACQLVAACGPPPPPSAASEQPPDPLASRSAEELLERARRFERMGDLARAAEYYEAALQRGADPRSTTPRLVDALARSGRLSQARLRAEDHLRRFPDAWRMRVVLATLLEALGAPHEAAGHLRRAAAEAPEEPLLAYLLGTLLVRLDEREEAEASLRRYLELAPHGEHAPQVREALASLRAGEPEEAETGGATDEAEEGTRAPGERGGGPQELAP